MESGADSNGRWWTETSTEEKRKRGEERESTTDLLAAAVLSHRVVSPVAVDPAVAVELKAVCALVGTVENGRRWLTCDCHTLTRLPGSILRTLTLKCTSVVSHRH